MPAPESDTDRLDPVPDEPIKLTTGLSVRIVPMQTRQVFRLLRILTHGAGGALLGNALDVNTSAEEFGGKLLTIAMLAIPDAESETIEFLASMCEPADVVKPASVRDELSEKVKESNQALWDQMNTDLFNPEPMTTLDILERVIKNEASDLQALGKRIGRLLETFQKTGQDKDTKPEGLPSPQDLSMRTPPSSVPSPPSSTPSAPSTAGPTSTSSPSPSDDSVPLEPPSVIAGQPSPASAGS
jgi:hypothetical protein